jgi:protease IV
MKKFFSRFFLGFFVGVGVITVVGAIFATWFFYNLIPQPDPVPKQGVLLLDFQGTVVENLTDDPFAIGISNVLSLRAIIETLDYASKDDRIKGLVVKTNDINTSIAHTEEIREAVKRFKNSGKFAYFYADTFGDLDEASNNYLLASIFEEIWIQPSGLVGLTGYSREYSFYKDAMSMLGVEAQFEQRREYKTAPNQYLHDDFTATEKEAETALMKSHYDILVNHIAKDRGIELNVLEKLIDDAPISPDVAKQHNLITNTGYWDDMRDYVEAQSETNQWIELPHYASRISPKYDSKQKIALIYTDGEITRGESAGFDFMPGDSFGGESIAEGIRDAVDNDDVVAIVLRVNCPGGSYPASDMIWHEVNNAKESGKPVIASIANWAASGGYFLLMSANRILASPSSQTGSIGVFAGKFVFKDLSDKLRVNWRTIKAGSHADMWSNYSKFSDSARKTLNRRMDFVYDDFVTKAAESRDIPRDKMEPLSRGRVYPAEEALKIGLIDQLGGYYDALRAAKKAAGIPEDRELEIVLYPRPKNFVDRISGLFEKLEDFTQTSRKVKKVVEQGEKIFGPVLESSNDKGFLLKDPRLK